MMTFGMTAVGLILVPVGFQFLAALAGKALLLSKMALLLAAINGLKKVFKFSLLLSIVCLILYYCYEWLSGSVVWRPLRFISHRTASTSSSLGQGRHGPPKISKLNFMFIFKINCVLTIIQATA